MATHSVMRSSMAASSSFVIPMVPGSASAWFGVEGNTGMKIALPSSRAIVSTP